MTKAWGALLGVLLWIGCGAGAQVQELETANASLQTENESLQIDKVALETKLDECEATLTDVDEALQGVSANAGSESQARAAAETENESLRSELETARASLAEELSRSAMLTDELESLEDAFFETVCLNPTTSAIRLLCRRIEELAAENQANEPDSEPVTPANDES